MGGETQSDKSTALNADAKAGAERARQWISSQEGQRALENALQAATAMSSHMSEARNVDVESLKTPVGQIDLERLYARRPS